MLAVSFFVTLSRNKVRMSPVRNHYQHLAVILAAIYERLLRGRAEPYEGQTDSCDNSSRDVENNTSIVHKY